MPSEGPDDIKAKMQEAIATFDDQEEVLFLVDLWGGTPSTKQTACFGRPQRQMGNRSWYEFTNGHRGLRFTRFSMNTAHRDCCTYH